MHKSSEVTSWPGVGEAIDAGRVLHELQVEDVLEVDVEVAVQLIRVVADVEEQSAFLCLGHSRICFSVWGWLVADC